MELYDIEAVKKMLEKHVTTIIWYGEVTDQQPDIILGNADEDKVWDIIKELFTRERGQVKADKLIAKEKVNGFINASLIRLSREKNKKYIELYGSVDELYCPKCMKTYDTKMFLEERKPRCPLCGSPLKPRIEPFLGEMGIKLEKSMRFLMTAELIISIGKNDVLEPASHLPWMAKNINDVKLVEVYPSKTSLSKVADIVVRMDPWEALRELSTEYTVA